MKKVWFAFEDLEVWQKAVEFSNKVIRLIEKIDTGRKHFRLIEQLEDCPSSTAMNIAEGKGRYSKKEFAQFLYIVVRGSLYEAVTLFIIFNRNRWITDDELEEMKIAGDETGKMLSSLINSVKKSI